MHMQLCAQESLSIVACSNGAACVANTNVQVDLHLVNFTR